MALYGPWAWYVLKSLDRQQNVWLAEIVVVSLVQFCLLAQQ